MINRNQAFSDYYRALAFLFFYWLGACFVFAVFRLIFLLCYGDFSRLDEYILNIFHAFWVGFLFDAKILAIVLAPWLLLQLLAFLVYQPRLSKRLFSCLRYILVVVSIILYIILIIDLSYYSYFQSHIDVRIFGLIEDDTEAILLSIWQEYPVIKVFFLVSLIFALMSWFIFKLGHKSSRLTVPNFKFLGKFSFIIFSLLFVASFARGSIGVFPLSRDHSYISTNQFVNILVSNGPTSLIYAWSDRKKFRYSTDMQPILRKYEYKNIKEAIQTYYGISNPQSPSKNYYFKATSSRNVPRPAKKYHLVLILMESWSGYYFTLHSPKFNIFAGLDKHIDAGRLIHFPNFFSMQNGTIAGLETLLILNIEGLISQTKYASRLFPTSVARIFRNQGYDAQFITSGSLSWRRLNFFLPKQGFNKLHGSVAMKKRYPQADGSPWGVFDQYMFDYITETLHTAKRPQFLTVLSTTHHPPYMAPKQYQALPLQIPTRVQERLVTEKARAKRAFLSFQYSNYFLARFIDKLHTSSLRDDVIVAITGDHNTWALFNFAENEIHWKYAVPFMLYLPPQLKKSLSISGRSKAASYKKIFASHFDIHTTVLPLIFPGIKTFQFGSNLLSSSEKKERRFAFNINGWAVNSQGAVRTQGPALYLRWVDEHRQKLKSSSASPDLLRLRRLAQARSVLINHAIREGISDKSQSPSLP